MKKGQSREERIAEQSSARDQRIALFNEKKEQLQKLKEQGGSSKTIQAAREQLSELESSLIQDDSVAAGLVTKADTPSVSAASDNFEGVTHASTEGEAAANEESPQGKGKPVRSPAPGDGASSSSASSTANPTGVGSGTEPVDIVAEDNMAEAIARLTKEFVYAGDPSTLGVRWSTWITRFDLATKAAKCTDEVVLKNVFLSRIGTEALDIYMTVKKEDDSDTFQELKDMFTARFVVQGSQMALRVKFGVEGKMQGGETVEEFHLRLRRLAEHCGFKDKDENIAYQLIIGCGDERLRQKVSRLKTTAKLAEVLELAKGFARWRR